MKRERRVVMTVAAVVILACSLGAARKYTVPPTTEGGYPLIAGAWKETEEIRLQITQTEGEFEATCAYVHPDRGPIRWEARGTIDRRGRMQFRLVYTEAPRRRWAKVHDCTARLDEQLGEIRGMGRWEGGDRDFVWTLFRRGQANPIAKAPPDVKTPRPNDRLPPVDVDRTRPLPPRTTDLPPYDDRRPTDRNYDDPRTTDRPYDDRRPTTDRPTYDRPPYDDRRPADRPYDDRRPPDRPIDRPPTLDPRDRRPVEPEPMDPRPIDRKPMDPRPVEREPIEPRPVDPRPVEPVREPIDRSENVRPIDPRPVNPDRPVEVDRPRPVDEPKVVDTPRPADRPEETPDVAVEPPRGGQRLLRFEEKDEGGAVRKRFTYYDGDFKPGMWWKGKTPGGDKQIILQGVLRTYYADGKKDAITEFREGVPDGATESWWPNGRQQSKGVYRQGKIVEGTWQVWDQEGNASTSEKTGVYP